MKVKLLAVCLFICSFSLEARQIDLKGLVFKKHSTAFEQSHTKIQFHFNQINTVEMESGFEKIEIKGMNLESEAGSPERPFRSLIVMGRPGDFKVNVDLGEGVLVSDLKPSFAGNTKCRCKEDKNILQFDSEKYYAKQSVVKVESFGSFRGMPISRVLVSPVSVSEQGTTFYTDMEVTVSQTRSVDTNALSANVNKKILVVVPQFLKDAIGPYVDLKTQAGYSVIVKELSEMGEDANAVNESIRSLYRKEKFSYSLFVGDEEVIPTFYLETTFDIRTPSDWPYFVMDGSDDVIPDVFHARLAVNSVDEVERFIQKINENINLSSETHALKNVLGVASNEGNNPSDAEYTEMFLDPFKSVFGALDTIFVQGSNGSAQDILDMFSSGMSWMNYIGHGSGPSWPSISGSELHIDQFGSMQANAVKPVIIDVACQNGRFSHDGRIGERIMNEHNNGVPLGAVAYYGGSVDISWHPPAIMAIGISESVANGESDLSKALMAGHLHLMANHSVKEDILHNFQWYHLQGDPTHVVRIGR